MIIISKNQLFPTEEILKCILVLLCAIKRYYRVETTISNKTLES